MNTPLRRGFGLSGDVLQLDGVFLPRFRVSCRLFGLDFQRSSRPVEVTPAGPSTPQIIASRYSVRVGMTDLGGFSTVVQSLFPPFRFSCRLFGLDFQRSSRPVEVTPAGPSTPQ